MTSARFDAKLGLQQRVLPAYRVPFFEALAACTAGLSVFAGQPLPQENIQTADHLVAARYVPARNLHWTDPGSPFYRCWQLGLLAWLRDWQPQALIVEANPRYASTPQAVRWMHSHNRPVLGWGLGAPPLSGHGPLGRVLAAWRLRARRAFLLTLDGVVAYSRHGAEEYRTLGFPSERVFTAPNAAVARPQTGPLLRQVGFNGLPSILFVGRLQARKRLDLLLRACAGLPQHLRPRLVIVGDGPARLELQEMAGRLYPNAEFPGARHGSDLEPFFEAADLFVLPGTGGLAVQQAMAAALPVMVAEGDGTQDDLVRPENGWRLPPGDLPALEAALYQALSDPGRLRQMGAASYRIVAEEVNLEAMLAVFVQALNSLCREVHQAL